jgi:hypothetical protein
LALSAPALVSALKMVDLPTFGRPTMPQLNPIFQYPYIRLIKERTFCNKFEKNAKEEMEEFGFFGKGFNGETF